MSRLMIIRKGARVMAALIGAAGTSLLPVASADPMPNGYDVSCKQTSPNQVVCSIGGCPRVKDQEAGDVVHTRVNALPQNEIGKACNATATETVNMSSAFTYAVQGCRKHPVGSDDCGAWSDYSFTPPAQAAPAPAPNSDKPVRCTAGGYTLPPGSDCSKTPNPNPPQAAPVAPSIDVTPNQGNQLITFTVHNTSTQDLQCNYNAKKLSGLFGPPTTAVGPFDLKPGATTPSNLLKFPEIPVGTTYQVDISCTGQNGGTVWSHNFSG
jgi:hypothetical protein